MLSSFQKFGRSNLTKNNTIRSVLNRFGPAYYAIYQSRSLSSNLYNNANLVEFIKLSDSNSMDLGKLKKTDHYTRRFGLKNKEIMKVVKPDIDVVPNDIFGAIILQSESEITLKYGDRGISPSKDNHPIDLLNKELVIPANSFGVLHIQRHVPFLIDFDQEKTIIDSRDQFTKVLEFKDNIKNYFLEPLTNLPNDASKILSINLQKRIFEDVKKERFYEEMTSKVFLPDDNMDVSGTLMNFDYADEDVEKGTNHHYHPGDRLLLVNTNNREAGVILNFCGVNENLEDRKDCEVKLDFKKNSLSILKFPAFTHHKFMGDFVCMSIHPKEGQNIIDCLTSGTLPKGFLESATVFSGKENQPWNILDSIDSNKGHSKIDRDR